MKPPYTSLRTILGLTAVFNALTAVVLFLNDELRNALLLAFAAAAAASAAADPAFLLRPVSEVLSPRTATPAAPLPQAASLLFILALMSLLAWLLAGITSTW